MSVLDLALLRTFIHTVDSGNLARAAATVGRSESAVSLQIKRLEQQVGKALFSRQSRRLVLTSDGAELLQYARQLLALSDEAVAAITRDRPLSGVVRIGAPQDVAETWLPALLAGFARAFPEVTVRTSVARSPVLLDRVGRKELDLALAFGTSAEIPALWSTPIPMCWIGRSDFVLDQQTGVPLAVFDPPCAFRSAATAALDANAIPWSVAFNSGSLAGLWSAVGAGLGVTVRTPIFIPSQLERLGSTTGLPDLPTVTLNLVARPTALQSTVVERLRTSIVTDLERSLATVF